MDTGSVLLSTSGVLVGACIAADGVKNCCAGNMSIGKWELIFGAIAMVSASYAVIQS